jgi:hypothetical protein
MGGRIYAPGVQQIFAFNELAVAVRHWFEIGPEDDEHGARLELRRLVRHPHRGSESAPQVLELDQIVWRVDLFDAVGDAPGSWSRAHHHDDFDGIEPTGRTWDDELSADPLGWTRRRLEDLPGLLARRGVQLADVAGESADVRRALPAIMAALAACGPEACRSPADCLAATRDTREITQIMLGMFRADDPRDPRPAAQ